VGFGGLHIISMTGRAPDFSKFTEFVAHIGLKVRGVGFTHKFTSKNTLEARVATM